VNAVMVFCEVEVACKWEAVRLCWYSMSTINGPKRA
jgi:hypothetical protein